MENKFDKFMTLNRELLDCYGQVNPEIYQGLDQSTQKDVCFSERSKLQEMLVKGMVKPEDFFNAAK